MKSKGIVLSTILVTASTFPCLVSAMEQNGSNHVNVGNEPAVGTAAQPSVQETVLLSRQENKKDAVQLSIAGRPNGHYKVLFATAAGKQLKDLPKAQGKLNAKGIAVVDLALGAHEGSELYLKVFTAADANFSRELRETSLLEIKKSKTGEVASACPGGICIEPAKTTTAKVEKTRGYSGAQWYSHE